jgi:hypothetical protein
MIKCVINAVVGLKNEAIIVTYVQYVFLDMIIIVRGLITVLVNIILLDSLYSYFYLF